jgi:hypothetical protein
MRNLTLLVVGLFLIALSDVTQAETQTFTSEASASADGWTEFGSRINNFDFGFSLTNNAEGVSGEGEGGGVVARSEPSAYYADVSIDGPGDLSIDLNATGRLKFQDSAFDGEFFFGWFDSVQAEANERDYIGIRVREPRDGLWRVRASIDGADGEPQLDIPDDTAFDFAINWDADGGATPGDGMLTVALTSLDGLQTFVSTVEGFDGTNVDAFGLLSNAQGGNPDQIGNFWFDDLDYSVIPEPSSIVAAIYGLLGLVLVRRRRR